MQDDSWAWVYEIIYSDSKEPKPELPEDILYMFTRKNPMVQKLIDAFELELEI